MNAKEARIEEVVALIRNAFAGTRHPGADRIIYRDGERYDLEGQELKELYRLRKWWEIDGEVMFATREKVCGLSVEAFRYFLPGFLVGALHHFDEIDTMADTVIWMLLPDSDNPDALRLAFERVDGYTKPQRDAIRAFIRLYHDDFADRGNVDDVKSALRFWESME